MRNSNVKSSIVLLGVLGFTGVVTVLQFVQDDYDPVHQLMSELVFGRYGFFMLAAFLSFSVAVFAVQAITATCKGNLPIRVLLIISSLSLAGAGVFKLGANTDLHIGLVAIAFIFIVLTMYLAPQLLPPFQYFWPTVVSRIFAVATALAVVLPETIIPAGAAQRVATGFILAWLLWIALIHHREMTR